jgi:uncharacterized membrane protein YsdA (DUF1294 family)/cold shock CspA family protein
MERTGRIIKFDPDKGFGFIASEDSRRDTFFHVSAIDGNRSNIRIGETVSFVTGFDSQGRQRATKLRRATSALGLRSALPAIIGAAAFLGWMAYLAETGTAPQLTPLVYAAVSAVSFAAYGMDKLSARQQARRTPEATLHLLDLIGGWPGGLIAQQLFRHKRRKVSFMAVFGVTAVLHPVYWAWITYDPGASLTWPD